MQRFMIYALCALLFIGVCSVAAEDSPAKSENLKPIGGLSFADEIELTVVNVLVHVTDKKGEAIAGLKAEDFRITQDSLPKPITNFQLYTDEIIRNRRLAAEAPGPKPTPSPDEVADVHVRPVYMIIYVDNENILPMDRNRVLRQIRPFVEENLFPPVRMMVISYQRSIEVVVPFTSDKSEVFNGLRSIMKDTGGRSTRESDRHDLLDKMRRYREDSKGSDADNYHNVLAQVVHFAEEEANDLSFSIGALREIATTMSGLPGKKSFGLSRVQ